jgi:hypothetical protein
MRYIVYIALIIAAATVGLYIFDQVNAPAPPEDAALIINNRTISLAELKTRYERNPYGATDRKAFLDSIITRELLIQEAQHTGIDKEENFRRSVQEFFEQSLIKVLMDRKLQEFQAPLSVTEIAAYRNRLNKRLQLSLWHYPTLEAAATGQGSHREALSETFFDLPLLLRHKILSLSAGEKSAPFATDHDFVVLSLDAETPLATGEYQELSEALLVKKIAEEKRALKMDQWVASLREKAHISILPQSAELGDIQ